MSVLTVMVLNPPVSGKLSIVLAVSRVAIGGVRTIGSIH